VAGYKVFVVLRREDIVMKFTYLMSDWWVTGPEYWLALYWWAGWRAATPRGRHSHGAYMNIRCCSSGVYTGDAVRLKYILATLFCWNIYGWCCSAWVYNYGRCCSAGIYKGDAGSGDPWEWRPLGVATPNRWAALVPSHVLYTFVIKYVLINCYSIKQALLCMWKLGY